MPHGTPYNLACNMKNIYYAGRSVIILDDVLDRWPSDAVCMIIVRGV
jgi:hypothetical protein